MYLLSEFSSLIKLNTQLKKEYIDVPYSLLIEKCLVILLNEGFILSFRRNNLSSFRVYLKYYKGKPVINNIKCISIPGFRKYITYSSLYKKYGISDLIILSTSKGIISNYDLFLGLKGVKNSKVNDLNLVKNKNLGFNNINSSLDISNFSIFKLNYGLDYLLFHKKIVLLSFYRSSGILNKLSKSQYLRNGKLKKYLISFINNKNKTIHDKGINLEILNSLFFFKFKKFFSSSDYLSFLKRENFLKYINKVNKVHLFSIFYFIFFLKQLNFSKYKYRFSLYLKYINHLIMLKKYKQTQKNKINNMLGGEPLLHIN